MRASFERAELLRVLGPAIRAVENRNTIPILGNIKLEVTQSPDGITDGTFAVTGTDLDIRITTTGACKVAEGGTVTVDARLFEGIVKKMPAEAIVEITSEENAIIVKAKRSRFKVATLPVDDFPDIAVGEFATTYDIDLAALFKPVQFAISTEETRFYLNGIYLHVVDGKLRAVATDGHRLARHDADLPEGAAEAPGVIVPRKTVGIVPQGVISVSVSPTKVRFVAPGLEVVSKVIDGTFPDYQRVIPRDNPNVAEIERLVLHAAADRVSSITGERGRAVKLSLADGALTLSARGDAGEASDEIAVAYDAEPIEIGFNAAYLRDVLGNFVEDKVSLRLNDPGTPAVLTGATTLLIVLMPMRVG